MKPRPLPYLAAVAAIAVVYYASARMGLHLGVVEQVTLIWPPSGIALAVLLLAGYRFWPAIFLGAFLANAQASEPFATAGGIAIGNTLEALAGAWLSRRLLDFQCDLSRLRDVLGLLFLAAALSTTASATIGVASLCLGGVHPWSLYGTLWQVWWLGDALGDAVLAPLLLTWVSMPRLAWRPATIVEAVLLVAAMTAIALTVFAGGFGPKPSFPPLEYTVFPLVIWAALRFGQRATTLVVFLSSGIAVWGTVNGRGPFAVGTLSERLMLLQVFTGVIVCTGLILAAVMSERKRVDESLRRSEERLNLAVHTLVRQKEQMGVQLAELENIYDCAPVGLVSVDRNLRYMRINEQLAAMNGRPTAEHIGRTIREIIPDLAGELEQLWNRVMTSGEPLLNIEVHGMTAAQPGVERHWLVNYVPLKSEAGGVVGATGAVVEITARKRAEQQLREYAERVQALSRQLLAVQEEERRHLARELHDEIGQSLTGLQFMLDAGPNLPTDDACARLQDARLAVDGLLAKVRELSFDLRPAILDHLGLLPALLWLFERFTGQTKVRVHFRHDGLAGRFAPEIETTAYRLVQEALTNVARHAGVKEASVRVWLQGGLLQLQVEDEGAGFDPAAALVSDTTSGLTGMRERTQLLGGQLVIDSVPGEGTQLMAQLPLGS